MEWPRRLGESASPQTSRAGRAGKIADRAGQRTRHWLACLTGFWLNPRPVVVALAIAVVVASGVVATVRADSPQPIPPAPSPVAPDESPASTMIAEIWDRVKAAGSYSFEGELEQTLRPQPVPEMIGQSSQHAELDLTGKVVLPDRVELLMHSVEGGLDPYPMRLIQAGDSTFLELNGRLEKIESPGMAGVPQGDYLGYLAGARNVENLGTIVHDGSVVTRLAFDIDGSLIHDRILSDLEASSGLVLSKELAGLTGVGELWIGDDGLPVREILDLEWPGATGHFDAFNHLVVDFDDFGDVSEFPAPVFDSAQQVWIAGTEATGGLTGPDSSKSSGLDLHGWLSQQVPDATGLTLIFMVVAAAEFLRRRRKLQVATSITMALVLVGAPAFRDWTVGYRIAEAKEVYATFADNNLVDSAVAALTDVWSNPASPGTSQSASPSAFPVEPSTKCGDGEAGVDTDGDSLSDRTEACLGTNPYSADTDGDGIGDLFEIEGVPFPDEDGNEVRWPGDPMKPDTNNDGILDTFEWTEEFGGQAPEWDLDGDGVPNPWDDDNDGDGVADGLDESPYSYTEYETEFEITTENPAGEPVHQYISIQLQPEDSDQLNYTETDFDWPDDNLGNIQDLDGSLDDMRLMPMLEVRANVVPDPVLARQYNVSISNDPDGNTEYPYLLYAPLVPVKNQGRVVAFQTKVVYGPEAGIDLRWNASLVWIVQGNIDRSTPFGIASSRQPVQTYRGGAFRLTSLDVTVSGSHESAILGTPGQADDRQLFNLIFGLNAAFLNSAKLEGQSPANTSLQEIRDRFEGAHTPFEQLWGIDSGVVVVDLPEPSAHPDEGIASLFSRRISDFLRTEYADVDVATLVVADEESSGATNLDEIADGTELHINVASIPVLTQRNLTVRVYEAQGVSHEWSSMDVEETLDVIAERYDDLSASLAALSPTYPDLTTDDLLEILLTFYMIWWVGQSSIIDVDGALLVAVSRSDLEISETLEVSGLDLPGYVITVANLARPGGGLRIAPGAGTNWDFVHASGAENTYTAIHTSIKAGSPSLAQRFRPYIKTSIVAFRVITIAASINKVGNLSKGLANLSKFGKFAKAGVVIQLGMLGVEFTLLGLNTDWDDPVAAGSAIAYMVVALVLTIALIALATNPVGLVIVFVLAIVDMLLAIFGKSSIAQYVTQFFFRAQYLTELESTQFSGASSEITTGTGVNEGLIEGSRLVITDDFVGVLKKINEGRTSDLRNSYAWGYYLGSVADSSAANYAAANTWTDCTVNRTAGITTCTNDAGVVFDFVRAQPNVEISMSAWVSVKTRYKECGLWIFCKRYNEYTLLPEEPETPTPVYMDVLPATLSDFWNWDLSPYYPGHVFNPDVGFAPEPDPFSLDTDEDGLSDAAEAKFGTDPAMGDTDGDGLTDGDEVFHRDPDTGTWSGGWELTLLDGRITRVFSNPLQPDLDGDGLSDKSERDSGLSPHAYNGGLPLLRVTATPQLRSPNGLSGVYVEPGQTFEIELELFNSSAVPVSTVLNLCVPSQIGSHTGGDLSGDRTPPVTNPDPSDCAESGSGYRFSWDFGGANQLQPLESARTGFDMTISTGIADSANPAIVGTIEHNDGVDMVLIESRVVIGIDAESPEIDVVAPLDGALLGGGTTSYVIGGSSSDATAWVEEVYVHVTSTNGSGGSSAHGASGTDIWAFTWDLPADGEYVIAARAVDVFDHSTWSEPVAVTVDNTAPVVSISSPISGEIIGSTSSSDINVPVAGGAVDALSGVARIQISIDEKPWREVELTAGGWIFDWVIPGANSAQGMHDVRARAFDHAGNLSAVATSAFVVDVVPPASSLTDNTFVVSPPSHPTGTPITIRGVANDMANIPVPSEPAELLGTLNSILDATVWLGHSSVHENDEGVKAIWAGDFNGDRMADMAIGLPAGNGGDGRISILYGQPGDWPVPPSEVQIAGALTSFSGDEGASIGLELAAAGDVNGDGFDDLLVTDTAGNRVHVVFGQPGLGARDRVLGDTPLPGISSLIVVPEGETITRALAAGDANGDGMADVLIATGLPDPRLYLVAGQPTWAPRVDASLQAAAVLDLPSATAMVTGAGDLDDDQLDDFLVGVPGDDVYVFGGSLSFAASALAPIAMEDGIPIFTTPLPSSVHQVAVGDVTGDSISDVVLDDGAALFLCAGVPDSATDCVSTGIDVTGADFVRAVGDVHSMAGETLGDILVVVGDDAFLYAGSPHGNPPFLQVATFKGVADAADAPYTAGADLNADGSSDLLLVPSESAAGELGFEGLGTPPAVSTGSLPVAGGGSFEGPADMVPSIPGDAIHADDDGWCGGESPCFALLQDAIDAAPADGFVAVHPGVYGPITIETEGLNVEGLNPDVVFVDGGGSAVGIAVNGATGVRLTNLTVRDASTAVRLNHSGVGGHEDEALRTVMEGVLIHKFTSNAIWMDRTSSLLVKDSTVAGQPAESFIQVGDEPDPEQTPSWTDLSSTGPPGVNVAGGLFVGLDGALYAVDGGSDNRFEILRWVPGTGDDLSSSWEHAGWTHDASNPAEEAIGATAMTSDGRIWAISDDVLSAYDGANWQEYDPWPFHAGTGSVLVGDEAGALYGIPEDQRYIARHSLGEWTRLPQLDEISWDRDFAIGPHFLPHPSADNGDLVMILVESQFVEQDGAWIWTPGGMGILDVSDPLVPVVVADEEIEDLYCPMGIELLRTQDGRHLAYVPLCEGGFQIVDVTDPLDPEYVGEWTIDGEFHGGSPLAFVGSIALLQGSDWPHMLLEVVDTTADPLDSHLVGTMQFESGFRVEMIDDDHVMVVTWDDGVHVVDISDPTSPTIAATLTMSGGPVPGGSGVTIDDGTALLFGDGFGLLIVDISTPTSPVVVGEIDVPDHPRWAKRYENLVVVGHQKGSWLSGEDSGQKLIDISDPTAPFLIDSEESEPCDPTPGGKCTGDRWSIASGDGEFVDGYLLMSMFRGGLRTLGISPKLAPAPTPIADSSAMAWAEGAIYLWSSHQGEARLYRYDPVEDIWTNLNGNSPFVPGTGASMQWGGDGYLYALAGGNGDRFIRYNLAEDTWEDLSSSTSAPAGVRAGSQIARVEDELFAVRGGGYPEFWKYSPIGPPPDKLVIEDTAFVSTSALTTSNWVSLDPDALPPDFGIVTTGENVWVSDGEWLPVTPAASINYEDAAFLNPALGLYRLTAESPFEAGYHTYVDDALVSTETCGICFTSIQSAIDSGANRVVIEPGEYLESIDLASGVTVVGSGASSTVVAGDGSPTMVRARGVAGASLTGVTLAGDGFMAGFTADSGATHITVSRSIVRDTPTAFSADGATTNVELVNNTAVNNGGGVASSGGASVSVRNTIFAHNSGVALSLDPTASSVHKFNLFWQNGADFAGAGPGPGEIFIDPLFVSPVSNDFRTTDASPTIDAGDPGDPAPPGTGNVVDIGYIEQGRASFYADDDYCGSCVNDGLTWGVDAFDTIQDALDAAARTIHLLDEALTEPGFTVGVGPGTYEEEVSLPSHIDLVGSGPKDTSIVGTAGSAVTFDGVVDSVIRGFSVTGASWAGILVTGASNSILITRNLVHDSQDAIAFTGDATGKVLFNTLVGSAEANLAVAGPRTWAAVHNNILAGGAFGFRTTDGGRIFHGYNLLHNTDDYLDEALTGLGPDATEIVGTDPLFADDINYWLTVASPGLDAAHPMEPVPPGGGSRADIGYFELRSAPIAVFLGDESISKASAGSGITAVDVAIVPADPSSGVQDTAPAPGDWVRVPEGRLGGLDSDPVRAWSTEFTPGADGLYRVYSRAFDTVLNTEEDALETYAGAFYADGTAPDVEWLPTDDTTGSYVELSATVSDYVAGKFNVARVYFEIDGENVNGGWSPAPWDPSAGEGRVFRAWVPLTVGDHTVTAVAEDEAGNRGQDGPIVLTVSSIGADDSSQPALTLTAPDDGSVVRGIDPVEFTGSALDEESGLAGVEVSVDGGFTWLPAQVDGSGEWHMAWRAPGEQEYVSYPVSVRATNGAGLETVVRLVITVDNLPPEGLQPITFSVEPGSFVSVGQTLEIGWETPVDGSGHAEVVLDVDESEFSTVADPPTSPRSGNSHLHAFDEAGVWFAHMGARDEAGNMIAFDDGPWYVSDTTNPVCDSRSRQIAIDGYMDFLGGEWDDNTERLGDDERPSERQIFYSTWAGTKVFIGWRGARWDIDGEMWAYIGAGATGTTDPVAGLRFLPAPATHAVTITGAEAGRLLKWNGSEWVESRDVVFSQGESGDTEIAVDVGFPITAPLTLFAFSVSEAGAVTSVFPTTNPVDGAWSEAYTWDSPCEVTTPNLGQPEAVNLDLQISSPQQGEAAWGPVSGLSYDVAVTNHEYETLAGLTLIIEASEGLSYETFSGDGTCVACPVDGSLWLIELPPMGSEETVRLSVGGRLGDVVTLATLDRVYTTGNAEFSGAPVGTATYGHRVDGTAPVLVVAGHPGTTLAPGIQTILGSADDGSGKGVARVEWRLKALEGLPPNSWQIAIGTRQWQLEVEVPGTEPLLELEFRALDLFGTASDPPFPAAFPVDSTGPVVDIDAGGIPSPVAGEYLVIRGLATDDQSPIALIETSVDGSNWQTAPGPYPVVPEGGQSWAFSWQLPASDWTEHVIEARATDDAGNVGPTTSMTVAVDTIAPKIESVAQLLTEVLLDGYIDHGGGVPTGPPVLSGVVADGSGAAVLQITVVPPESGYGRSVQTVLPNADGEWEFTPVLVGLTGTHTLTVSVIDGAGNDMRSDDRPVFSLDAVNTPPVADAGGPVMAPEGSVVELDGSASYDADSAEDIVAYLWDLDEDGAFDDASGAVISALYDDNGSFLTRLKVIDQAGDWDIDETTVNVWNVAPSVLATGGAIDEGGTVIGGVSFSDPSLSDFHVASIDWGDGSFPIPSVVTSPFTPNHTYVDDGVYTMTVTVTDDDGGAGSSTATVTVVNVAPTVSTDDSIAITEGDVMSLDSTFFTDPGSSDTHTATIDWGDGMPVSPGTVDQVLRTVAGTHEYTDNGAFTVTVMVVDDDGAEGSDSFTVQVANADPTLDAGSDQNVAEGSLASLASPAIGDPGTADTHAATVDWGDGSPVSAASVDSGGVITGSHVYADNDTYEVTITATDDDGGSAVDSFSIMVANAPPTVDGGEDLVGNEGSVISLTAAMFVDPGSLDTHTATVDWGDGTSSAGSVVESPTGPPGSLTGMSGSISGSHVYADNGVYNVTIWVSDDDGEMDSDTVEATVLNVVPVLDPMGTQSLIIFDEMNIGPVSFGDMGTLDTHTATVDWGDGSVPELINVDEIPYGPPGSTSGNSGTILCSHVYSDAGYFTATVTVIDDDGGTDVQSFYVAVTGSRSLIQHALEGLDHHSDESKHIGHAQKKLESALEDKDWVDETHADPKKGQKIFSYTASAVAELEKALKDSRKNADRNNKDELSAEALAAIALALRNIEIAIVALTDVRMDESADLVALDPKKQKKVDSENSRSLKEYEEGLNFIATDRLEKGIRELRKAWIHAVHAEKHALITGKTTVAVTMASGQSG